MNCLRFYLLFLIPCLICTLRGNSQYILNGSATKDNCNCYTLTLPETTQSGSVWNANKISLKNSFDFWFNVFLGCKDADGADGIVFILQPLSTSIGSSGEGMGFSGVSPSIGIALDTWQNFNQNDPFFDHISIQSNGNVNHLFDLVGPVPISASSNNVEDCQWHKLRISWDPATQWLRAYFDGVLRVEKQIDLVASIFNNDPNVYWGFTGATGGAVNLQRFCTALDPDFNTNFPNNAACVGAPVQFSDQSVSFAPIASYSWDLGDGSTSTLSNPQPHIYARPGNYQVALKIKGMDGCDNDTVKTVIVGALPKAGFNIFDTCYHQSPRVLFSTPTDGVHFQWDTDNSGILTSSPVLNGLQAGPHTLEQIANSEYNCGKPDTAAKIFFIKQVPLIDASSNQLCASVQFSAVQKDNQTTIDQWTWNFGDGHSAAVQNPIHVFSSEGLYSAQVQARGSNGCNSDPFILSLRIPAAHAFAGNDTTVIRNLPFQLNGQGNGSFQWSPSIGLSNPFIADPMVTLSDKQDYVLTVRTTEGCVAMDTIHIKAFEGPAVYVPSAFTPNGDGLNDILRPVYVGMSKLERFTVYTRWGEKVFSTSDIHAGWNGKIGPNDAGIGTYVWTIEAENYLQQKLYLKGTVTIIR
ncbi:MAG: lectin-like domain-containing protein [Flavisolibacter sp.]